MKPNWLIVCLVVMSAVALIGWVLYVAQVRQYDALLAEQPTPAPFTMMFGAIQDIKPGEIALSVQVPGAETGTLEERRFPVAQSVSILIRDVTLNEYVSAKLTDLVVGSWVQINTDDSGIVISITAG